MKILAAISILIGTGILAGIVFLTGQRSVPIPVIDPNALPAPGLPAAPPGRASPSHSIPASDTPVSTPEPTPLNDSHHDSLTPDPAKSSASGTSGTHTPPIVTTRARLPESEQIRALATAIKFPALATDYLTISEKQRRAIMKKYVAPLITATLADKADDVDAFDGALTLATLWTGTSQSDRDAVRGPLGRRLNFSEPVSTNDQRAAEFADWVFKHGKYWRYYVYCCKMRPRAIAPRLKWILDDAEILNTDANRALAAVTILYCADGNPTTRHRLQAIYDRIQAGDPKYDAATLLKMEVILTLIRNGKPIGFTFASEARSTFAPYQCRPLITLLQNILDMDPKTLNKLSERDRVTTVLNELDAHADALIFTGGRWTFKNGKHPKHETF